VIDKQTEITPEQFTAILADLNQGKDAQQISATRNVSRLLVSVWAYQSRSVKPTLIARFMEWLFCSLGL
jgi:hypothetical protein